MVENSSTRNSIMVSPKVIPQLNPIPDQDFLHYLLSEAAFNFRFNDVRKEIEMNKRRTTIKQHSC